MNFVREYPLEWGGRTYLFDFAFPEQRVVLETNGRRWHDDPSDYEHDQEKWSVPGRWATASSSRRGKVMRRPVQFLRELTSTVGDRSCCR